MNMEQRAYAHKSVEKERSKWTPLMSQRFILAGLSLGLWMLVSWFALWNNSGNSGTFSFTEFTFYAQTDHQLLVFGLAAFTGLLLYINIIFKPSRRAMRKQAFSDATEREKLHVQSTYLFGFPQSLHKFKPLAVTVATLLLWILTFICVAWQISDHPLSLSHYILYNQSPLGYFQDQIVYGFLFFFALISGLVFFINQRLYKRS